jgi:hypothetical protein
MRPVSNEFRRRQATIGRPTASANGSTAPRPRPIAQHAPRTPQRAQRINLDGSEKPDSNAKGRLKRQTAKSDFRRVVITAPDAAACLTAALKVDRTTIISAGPVRLLPDDRHPFPRYCADGTAFRCVGRGPDRDRRPSRKIGFRKTPKEPDSWNRAAARAMRHDFFRGPNFGSHL